MKDMLSTEHEDTTQFIIDTAEAALVRVRKYIEEFLGYDASGKALMELWTHVQRLLDMLQPFEQLPGVVIPGVGDIGAMVEEFMLMQKMIYDQIPAEQREEIKKQVEEEKKRDKRSIWEKMGNTLEDQARQTWEAVQILVEEIPRIKEDLFMLCLEKSWGLIVKICKILGIPIDVFPFDLLADLPEIVKLSRDLERNGKKMLEEGFQGMMAPIYMARATMDSIPTTNDMKLLAVCTTLVQNKYDIEYQKCVKRVEDLRFRKKRCENQMEEIDKKIEAAEARMAMYSGSALPGIQNTFEVVKKEAIERKAVLPSSADRIDEKIPVQITVRDNAEAKKNDKVTIQEEGTEDYNKAKASVDEKNAEIVQAWKARDEDLQKRRQYILGVEASDDIAVVEGTDDASDGGCADAGVLTSERLQGAGPNLNVGP